MSVLVDKCRNCQFVHEDKNLGLVCRRFPPQHTGGVGSRFPTVSLNDWCGEHAPQ